MPRTAALALCFVALLAAGCGAGWLVRPGEPLALGGNTLFALAEHGTEYATLTFCRDADYAACLTTGQLPREGPVRVYALPPGRYCLLDILVEPRAGGSSSVHHPIDPEQADCFVAEPDVINYPGDLRVDARPSLEQGAWWRVTPQWSWQEDIDARVYAQYPNVRGRPIVEASLERYRR